MFQVRAENSHGLSAPSPFSNVVQTLKFAPNRLNPSQAVSNQKDLDDIRSHLNAIQVVLKEAKPMSANSVKLIWELVHREANQQANRDAIEGYYIRFRDVGPDLDELQNDLKLLNRPSAARMANAEHQKFNMLTVLTSGSNVNSYVISDLSEFTLYELFVVPFYKSVDGPPSNSRLVRTLADLPSAPPAEVKAHLLNLTAISVHWRPVPKPQRNGIIQAYNVMLVPIQLAANSSASNGQAPLNGMNGMNAINGMNNMNAMNVHNGLHHPHHHLFNHQLQAMDSIPAPNYYLDALMPPYAGNVANPSAFDSNGHMHQMNTMHTMNGNLYPNAHSSSIFPPPPPQAIDYPDNGVDLSSAALLSRNAPVFSANMHPNEQATQHANSALLNQLSRNLTTNANTHQLTIVGLQPGAIYQLRIAAANMIGYGPASSPILLQMNAEYIIEMDREEVDGPNADSGTERKSSSTFNRNLFNSKIITIVFTVSLTGLLIGAICFVINRRSQNLNNKFDKTNGSILNKNKFPFTSSSSSTKKDALFSNNPMISAADSLTSPTDALWIDRNWLAAAQNGGSQAGDYPLLKNNGLHSRTDHRSTSSAIYASTSQLNCSRPSLANPSNGEYCGIPSQNEYAEVSELGAFTGNSSNKFDSSAQPALGYTLSNIGAPTALMPSNAYATTTLINLNQNTISRVNCLPGSNSSVGDSIRIFLIFYSKEPFLLIRF